MGASSPGPLTRLVPGPIRRRFALKLGALLFVVLLVVTASGATIYAQTGDAIRTETEQQMVDMTVLQAEMLHEWVHGMSDRTTSLSDSPAVRSGEVDRISSALTEEAESMPGYVGAIYYVDAGSTEVLASSAEGMEGTRLAAEGIPWADGRVAAGEDDHGTGDHSHKHGASRTAPYRDPAVGGPSVAFVSPIEDQDGRVVVVVVDLERRSEAIQRPGEPPAFTHVVDDDGTVVLSHRTGTIGQQNIGGPGVDSDGVDRGFQDETGYVTMDMGEQVMSMGFAPVDGADWVVMTHIPKSAAFQLQSTVLESILGLVFVSMLALAGIGVVIGRGTSRSLRNLAATAEELKRGNLGVECRTAREDELGQLYRSFDAMREALRERIREAQMARREAEQAREESETLNRHLETKAEEYREVMRSCAGGDFTRRMDPESHSDAMAEIAEAFNDMLDDIESIVERVKVFAESVATASEEVTASSEEIQSSSDQVAKSVQEISDGAERQDETLASVVAEMNALSTTIEEIASSADEVATVAEETAETGDEARDAARAAFDEMETVQAEVDDTAGAIERLQDRMERIEEITEFITDVAEQTNVLALNANIEAARAGEAGEGFAVVAEEVKALAEETRDAAGEIDQLVDAVLGQTERTADEVRETSEAVARSTTAVERTVRALEEIAGYAEETNTGVQQISAATADQADSTNEAVAMVDEAAAIAEQTAEEASTVVGATEEQTAALSQMTQNASDLTAEADRLRTALDRFETSGASPAAGDVVAVENPAAED